MPKSSSSAGERRCAARAPVTCLLAAALSAPPAAHAQVRLQFEEPAQGNTYSGIANVRGWALSSTGSVTVQLSIDGGAWIAMPYGGTRADVAVAFPQYPDAQWSGFSMALSYDELQSGAHHMTVRACDLEGCVEQRNDFQVAAYGKGFLDQVDLSQARVEIVDGHLVIEGAKADDQTYSLRLDWLPAAQNFMPSAITPIEAVPPGIEIPPDVTWNYYQTQFVDLINGVRAAGRYCGDTFYPAVPAVSWNALLANAALAHSVDMAANDYFSHTGLDGSNFSSRAASAGYTGWPVGENIAAGYPTAAAAMQGWVDSPGHCSLLMNDAASEFGAAYAGRVGTEWGTYWTLVGGHR